MTRYLTAIILSLGLTSCNYFSKEKVEERINTSFKEANAQLETDYRNASDTFNLVYQKVISNSKDSIRHNKILFYRSGIISTVNNIDTLRAKIKHLNKDDSESIKRIFLTENIADSLLDKVIYSYTLAEELALTTDYKSAIRKEREKLFDFKKSRNQVFGMNTPEPISWFLFALETELLRTSSLSLKSD